MYQIACKLCVRPVTYTGNVVWMEPVTAARAMIHMSNVREENQIKQDKESMNSRNSTEDKENEKTTSESMEIENGKGLNI